MMGKEKCGKGTAHDPKLPTSYVKNSGGSAQQDEF